MEIQKEPLMVGKLVKNSAILFKNNFKLLFLLGIIGSIPFSISAIINVSYKGSLFDSIFL